MIIHFVYLEPLEFILDFQEIMSMEEMIWIELFHLQVMMVKNSSLEIHLQSFGMVFKSSPWDFISSSW